MVEAFGQRITEENTAIMEKNTETQGFTFHFLHLCLVSSIALQAVGKVDPKKRLEQLSTKTIETNLSQSLGLLLTSVAF